MKELDQEKLHIVIDFKDIKYGLKMLKQYQDNEDRLGYYRLKGYWFKKEEIHLLFVKKDYIFVPFRSTYSCVEINDRHYLHTNIFPRKLRGKCSISPRLSFKPQ